MPVRRQTKHITDADLNALLAQFKAGTTVDDKKAIHFHHLDFDELERILPDAFEVDPAFSPRQIRNLLRQALYTCRKNDTLTINALIAEAVRIARSDLSKPCQNYSSWTKFRARQMPFHEAFRLKWDGVSLESANRLPAYMLLDEYFLNGHGHIKPQEPTFYGHLIARCEARTEDNAASKMLDAIDIFMALFNLYQRWGRVFRSDQRWAEGGLWNGPYHFIFRGRKFLGNDRIWFDPNFSFQAWDMFPLDMKDVLKLMPRVRRALKALKSHPMRKVLTNVLRLMQNAMSSRDQSYTLLRYWSALEQFYGEPNSHEKSYPRIIQRASFAETDKVVARWKLAHISRLRNEYVHAGDNNDELRVMAQYLRMLLSRHINYLLFNESGFVTHKQWLDFVDLPDSEEALSARREAIDRRIALIRREPTPASPP
jgi:hypothetical protein